MPRPSASTHERNKMKIRLALRREGTFWNAYIALHDSMQGAKMIGAIAIGTVKKNPEIRAAFMDLMQQILADAIKNTTGTEPDEWNVTAAPEAERAGHS